VEIGSWKGKSTIWLAKGAKAGSQNEVFAIDPHQGSKAHTDEGEESTYPTFLTNLEKAHVQDIVVSLVTTSSKASESWRRRIGLLWIDGSHEYEDVKYDLILWKKYLSCNGIVALHDCDKPGPARVIEECFASSDEFKIIESTDTIVAAVKC